MAEVRVRVVQVDLDEEGQATAQLACDSVVDAAHLGAYLGREIVIEVPGDKPRPLAVLPARFADGGDR